MGNRKYRTEVNTGYYVASPIAECDNGSYIEEDYEVGVGNMFEIHFFIELGLKIIQFKIR